MTTFCTFMSFARNWSREKGSEKLASLRKNEYNVFICIVPEVNYIFMIDIKAVALLMVGWLVVLPYFLKNMHRRGGLVSLPVYFRD